MSKNRNNALFVDAGAWIALSDRHDKFHETAKTISSRLSKNFPQWVTTNLVVAETHVLIRKRGGHLPAIRFLETMRQSKHIHMVYADVKLETLALEILRQYDDQDFSYADAVSFAVMRQRGISEVFTFDHHFSVLGFLTLPEIK